MLRASPDSGASGGDQGKSELGVSATAHGEQLLKLDYSIDQAVHDYGDLCQAVTELTSLRNQSRFPGARRW